MRDHKFGRPQLGGHRLGLPILELGKHSPVLRKIIGDPSTYTLFKENWKTEQGDGFPRILVDLGISKNQNQTPGRVLEARPISRG